MEILLVVGGIILVMILFAANSSSAIEKLQKQEAVVRAKNELKFNQVISNEKNEKSREFLTKAKELFENGESLDFLDVHVKVGVPEEIVYSKDAKLIESYMGFENEQAKHLFTTYCFSLSKRYELKHKKLKIVDDVFNRYKLVLNDSEVLYERLSNVYCSQEKVVRRNITYSGVRWGNGLLRMGSLSYSVNDTKTFVIQDFGNLYVTNKRIIFVGKEKKFTENLTINSITDFYLYKDSILLCRNNNKNIMFIESQIDNHSQPDDDYYFDLNDFPIQFISIIERIANNTENQEVI